MLANEEHWPKVCKIISPFFVPFFKCVGRPPKYNTVLGFGVLTPTSPLSSHPDSPENEKTETTFTFPATVQPVSLPSPNSTDVSNSCWKVCCLKRPCRARQVKNSELFLEIWCCYCKLHPTTNFFRPLHLCNFYLPAPSLHWMVNIFFDKYSGINRAIGML